MGLFTLSDEARAWMVGAVSTAAARLGLYTLLANGDALEAAAIVAALGLPSPRVRALLDVLACTGALRRVGARFALGASPPAIDRSSSHDGQSSPGGQSHGGLSPHDKLSPHDGLSPHGELPAQGWGLLADVIRRDRPLPDDEQLDRFHAHLRVAGAEPARALAETLAALPSAARGLIDLGGGAGIYTDAFLARLPSAPATLVDRAAVIALARPFLDGRARLVSGDLLDGATPIGDGHGIALLANVLHLYGAADCAALVARAAAAVAPGGWVVVKDLWIAADRSGPLESLLFAVNMALYTGGGDVHDSDRIAGWLSGAGLVDLTITTSADELVVRGRKLDPVTVERSIDSGDTSSDMSSDVSSDTNSDVSSDVSSDAGVHAPDERREILARMEASRSRARAELAAAGRRRAPLDPRPLDPPRALLDVLAAELAPGDAHAQAIERHYLELMPRMRAEQLDVSDGPAALFFGATLEWDRLPRLSRAVEKLFSLLPPGVTLAGAAGPSALRARRFTVAELFRESCYGGFMPLLYGYPADLAYFARALEREPLAAVIDRYLAAPLIHELTHFGRRREVLSLYLDECIAAWLGVHVMPEFAFPAPGDDNGLYATPWFAQVGQALARVAGAERVIAAQAGVLPWRDALPPGLADALVRLGREDHRVSRPLHLLSDSYAPDRWMKLCFLAAAHVPVDSLTLEDLARLPWSAIPAGEESEADAPILRDALRAMCLRNFQIDRSFRVSSRPPPSPIAIDLVGCRVSTAPGPDGFDGAAPAYLFPPAAAARLRHDGTEGFTIQPESLNQLESLIRGILGY